ERPPLGELEVGDRSRRRQVGQVLAGQRAGLDAHGEVDLFGPVEQRDPADLLEVHAHRVGGAAPPGVARRPVDGGTKRPAAGEPPGGDDLVHDLVVLEGDLEVTGDLDAHAPAGELLVDVGQLIRVELGRQRGHDVV